MNISIEDGYDIAERCAKLGVQVPTLLALLPRNFASASTKADLLYDPHASTLRKLWLEAGIEERGIEDAGDAFPRALERSADWLGPTLFISWLLLSQNPHLVDLAISILVRYAEQIFLDRTDDPKVTLDVVVEVSPKKTTKRVHYEGSVAGLSSIREAIALVAVQEVHTERDPLQSDRELRSNNDISHP